MRIATTRAYFTLVLVSLCTGSLSLSHSGETPTVSDAKAQLSSNELLETKSFWDWDRLTGNWWGARDTMAQHGVVIESSVTQLYQGAVTGGSEREGRYGGKWDLYVFLDSEGMGFWKGGKLTLHAVDWQFGHNSNLDVVGLAPVNANLTTPLIDGPTYALTALMFEQQLPYGFLVTFGRSNVFDLWTALYPDYGRGVDGFMNMAFLLPMNAPPSLPFITNSAGIMQGSPKELNAAFFVMESQNSPTTIGLDFPNGVTFLGLARYNSHFANLRGTHTILGAYANGEYNSLDTGGWVFTPGQGIAPSQERGTWMVSYIGEQRFWQSRDNENRYAKLMGRVGYSREETSPFGLTASISAEAFGPWEARPLDRMGVGYFYNGVSGELKDLLEPINPQQDIHGGEIYYNMALTPWLHVTGDLQVILPSSKTNETAVVLGLRAKVDL